MAGLQARGQRGALQRRGVGLQRARGEGTVHDLLQHDGGRQGAGHQVRVC